MKDKTFTESQLRALLSRFVNADILTSELLITTHRYLFQRDIHMPFFKNTELFDTVVYLREIMEINDLRCLEDIFYYYEKKKKSIQIFMEEVIKSSDVCPANTYYLGAAFDLHWEKEQPGAGAPPPYIPDVQVCYASHFAYDRAPVVFDMLAFVLQIKNIIRGCNKTDNMDLRSQHQYCHGNI